MSESDGREAWDDWRPMPEDPDGEERFKWGWNAVDGETVWAIGGAGDGFPAHAAQLTAAWGREPSSTAGDVLGAAQYVPARASEPAAVDIHPYYGEPVPVAVVDWFREAFPDAQLRERGTASQS